MSSPKVFTIGFNKTGTTSLTSILRQYGLSVTHDSTWDRWIINKRTNNFARYDAFTDGNQKDFRALDEMFPGSKFILNTRPLKNWMVSRWCHVETNKRTKRSKWVNNGEEFLKAWAYSRDNYHADIVEYFKDRPDDFMVLDIQTMDVKDIKKDLDKVLNGVARKVPGKLSIPRSNSSNASLKNTGKIQVNKALDALEMHEEDKNSNVVSNHFYEDKYPEYIVDWFYKNHENPKIWYKPLAKKK